MAKDRKPADSVMLERCPEYRDGRRLLEHGVAMMVRVSRGEDMGEALKAAEWLVGYAERLMNGKREGKEEIASTVSPLRVCSFAPFRFPSGLSQGIRYHGRVVR